VVSIIICTYNRADILKLCLNSIVKHAGVYINKLEIIIVDNNSSDHTLQVANEFNILLPIRYFFEAKQGLSMARNCGGENARYEWLFYLDDDGMIQKDTFYQLFHTIETYDFDVFGGTYEALYLSSKPEWISNDFGTKKVKATSIKNLDEDTIEGGIMVIKKTVFDQVGKFNRSLGMNGKTIGYSEESDFFFRAKNIGFDLGINPFFKIHHIVGCHKYKVLWHLKAYYALGRDKINDDLEISIFRTFILFPFRTLKYFIKYLSTKEFYFENFIWFSFNNTFYLCGRISNKFKGN
jgi:glucosyl-dolichyl phosphate glucuronosyltransferase